MAGASESSDAVLRSARVRAVLLLVAEERIEYGERRDYKLRLETEDGGIMVCLMQWWVGRMTARRVTIKRATALPRMLFSYQGFLCQPAEHVHGYAVPFNLVVNLHRLTIVPVL